MFSSSSIIIEALKLIVWLFDKKIAYTHTHSIIIKIIENDKLWQDFIEYKIEKETLRIYLDN